jgi:hypothetical protein
MTTIKQIFIKDPKIEIIKNNYPNILLSPDLIITREGTWL